MTTKYTNKKINWNKYKSTLTQIDRLLPLMENLTQLINETDKILTQIRKVISTSSTITINATNHNTLPHSTKNVIKTKN